MLLVQMNERLPSETTGPAKPSMDIRSITRSLTFLYDNYYRIKKCIIKIMRRHYKKKGHRNNIFRPTWETITKQITSPIHSMPTQNPRSLTLSSFPSAPETPLGTIMLLSARERKIWRVGISWPRRICHPAWWKSFQQETCETPCTHGSLHQLL